MTLSLPPHHENLFKDFLAEIANSQNNIGVDTFHLVLGDIRSMAISLTGTRGLFRHMQAAQLHMDNKRVALTKGIHQAIEDFQWIAEYLGQWPTRMY